MFLRSAIVALMMLGSLAVAARAGQQPNVLFIAIDDLRPELGTYGSTTITPHIDRLAATGMRFDRAYCQQAVCGASRLSIMGGLYPTRTREQTFHVDGWRTRHPDLLTLNQHFGEQGYETIGLGKIYHGTAGKGVDPDNWHRWINVGAPDYALPANLAILETKRAAADGDRHDPPKGPTTEVANVDDDTYCDGKRAARAVAILDELARTEGGRPFFLAVGLSKPHLPFVAPRRYWDLYRREDFAMPANKEIPPGYPKHAANVAAHEMRKYSDYEGESPADFPDAMNRRLLHGYAAATSYVDACVGRILDRLEQTGLAENTVVVLWGDHGYKLGNHGTWTKHTNFECDTRVPLIIRDPRLAKGGKSTPRLVELIDLYPTLCELAGIPTPEHCQGRSFRALLEDTEAGHRHDAYSSYPTHKSLGHSIRIGRYRYSEWRDNETDAVSARVLTDLQADPGEVTNVADDPAHATMLAEASQRLQIRIDEALQKPAIHAPTTVVIDPREANLRQVIDGFGGSIAFWGTRADDEALEAAVLELGIQTIRAQGEISPEGNVAHNREILQRAMQLKPDLGILLTFWQPRSVDHLDVDYWIDEVLINGQHQLVLKAGREDEWAREIVARARQYLDWGINVTTIGVQNESNWSHRGAQTCRWEPDRLATFISENLAPRLEEAGLEHLAIAAPDLAYIGGEASEVERFLPTITNPHVDVFAYHMYDSYREGLDGNLEILAEKTRRLGQLRRKHFPDRKLWMTETTGTHWNNVEWHTYGWTRDLTEHDKAIKAARYIHMSLVDAEANAFFWWGLVYSPAPDRVTDPDVRQKHRDEGLVLVAEKAVDGHQRFLERTPKFHTFRQYSNHVRPGYRRIALDSPDALQVAAFRSPAADRLVVVAVNDSDSTRELLLETPDEFELDAVIQTDGARKCEPVGPGSALPPMSVRTYVYRKPAFRSP